MNGMSAFLSGAAVGLAITVPIGPMSMLCIQRVMQSGALAGFATGLGAATVLGIYTTWASLGFGPAIAMALGSTSAVLPAISACLLVWLGMRAFTRTVSLVGSVTAARGALSSYCSAVACALLNPLTPALLAAVLPTIAAPEPNEISSMIAGVVAASVTWWLIVCGTVAVLRSRLSETFLNLFNKASGVGLGMLGLTIAANALNLHISL